MGRPKKGNLSFGGGAPNDLLKCASCSLSLNWFFVSPPWHGGLKAPTQFAQNFLGNTPKGSKVPRNKEFLGVCYARPVFRF
jgi:hypothetical protein